MNRNNLPADTLMPPAGALEKIRDWALVNGFNSLAALVHKDHAEVLANKHVQKLLDDLEDDFSAAGTSKAGKLWNGESAFTPVVVKTPTETTSADTVIPEGQSHIVGNSFSSKYLILSLTELENGKRTVVVRPRLERKHLQVYELLRENARATHHEKVIAALSADGHKVLNAVVYKVVNGELDARLVRADSAPVWAKTLLTSVVKDIDGVQLSYKRASKKARNSYRSRLRNAVRREFAKSMRLLSALPGAGKFVNEAVLQTPYVMGADGDVMQEKSQRVAGHGSGKVVRLI